MEPVPASDPYFAIGNLHFPTSTKNEDAQTWFDRGMTWAFAFGHGESLYCFKQSVLHDPEYVMGWWGVSYRSGPNYNATWDLLKQHPGVAPTLKAAKAPLEEAKKFSKNATELERDLVEAMETRYPNDESRTDCQAWDEAYADAFKSVYEKHGKDPHIAALYGEALMQVSPWKQWDVETGKPNPKSRAVQAREVLEKAIKQEPLHFAGLGSASDRSKISLNGIKASGQAIHPGLHHLYVHLMEASHEPELAIYSADAIRSLLPDGGHLLHMPSHIDVVVGDYRNAIASNYKAIEADHRYFAKRPTNDRVMWNGFDMAIAVAFPMHNALVATYAAMLSGQYRAAIYFADQIQTFISPSIMNIYAFILEPWLAPKLDVWVRFGKWDELKKAEVPKDPNMFYTTAVTHYARGVAYAATGEVEKAEAELGDLLKAIDKVPENWIILPENQCKTVLAVPRLMLEGEIAYRKSEFEKAFDLLQQAVKANDNLQYGEPWPWKMPPRHAYAALSLEQGKVEQAMRSYEEDLGYVDTLPRPTWHPNNVWALHGYHECLVKLGKKKEAAVVKSALDVALAVADVDISSSCFCRRGETNGCC